LSAVSSLDEALQALMRLGSLMLRAGSAAFRVREWMEVVAPRLGIERLAVHISVDGMVATGWRGREHATFAADHGPPGIDAFRLGALERLARDSKPDLTPQAFAAELDAIFAAAPLRPAAMVALAVGVASGAFAYLNGGNPAGILAAFVAGGFGQYLRLLLLRGRLNQFAVTALCAAAASGLYTIAAMLLAGAGLPPLGAAGFIAAALFLVPGFPLVASLLDLIQHQTVAGLVRLGYAFFMLLAAALGLCVVAAIVPPDIVDASLPSPDAATYLLRAVACFLGGAGFAILYNSSTRTVLAVGGLALVGNELRLALHDHDLALPLATLIGSLTVGLLASWVRPHLHEPRMAVTVPAIIIMVPGIYSFQAVVLFATGDAIGGLDAAVLAGFVLGAMAVGLAAARFITQRKWRLEA
jgi:uncharacterized membrane protein YjjP (DUF1212 family)